MYNRYIRNDRGSYTRIPESDDIGAQNHPPGQPRHDPERSAAHSPDHGGPHIPQQESNRAAPPPHSTGIGGDGISRSLRLLLDRFHLEKIDTGDLLLLLLLFLLFKEDADEELLFALGLLLIL